MKPKRGKWRTALASCALHAGTLAAALLLMKPHLEFPAFALLAALALCDLALFVLILLKTTKPMRKIEKMVETIEQGTYASHMDRLLPREGGASEDAVDRLVLYTQQIMKANYDSQILKSRAEIHALQSQINPHFLYNTLETIRSQAIMQGSDSIEEMTEALASLFRYSISRPGAMATLREEIENVERYMLIQQYRFPDKFRLIKHIENEGLLTYKLPVLTLQPLIENAIHHGLELKMGPGTVRIRVIGTQTSLVIIVSDDGVGIDQQRLSRMNEALGAQEDAGFARVQKGNSKETGIALINVNQRIRFYFGKAYGLRLYSSEDVGTTVELTLPGQQVELHRGEDHD